MSFDRISDFWFENVLFGPFELTYWLMGWADEWGGTLAAFIVLSIMVIPMMAAVSVLFVVTGLLIVLTALSAPITLPVAIYIQRRKNR